jgi:hypothetical protein
MEELTLEQLQARLAAAESEKAEALAKASAAEAQKNAAEAKASDAEAKASDLAAEKKSAQLALDDAAAEIQTLKSAKKELEKAAKADSLPTFEADDDEYEFTCPTLTWDDNSVIDVRKLAAEAEEDEVAAEKFADICGKLVHRGSGIVRKVERKED